MEIVIDISEWQEEINWDELYQEFFQGKFHGCIIKASQGTSEIDAQYSRNRSECERLGIPHTFYHFANFESAIVEGNHFKNVIGRHHPLFRVALDSEWPKNPPSGISVPVWARTFNRSIESDLNYFPVYYSNTNNLQQVFTRRMQPVGDGLWEANYGINSGKPFQILPAPPWKKLLMHQFTSEGRLNGIKGFVDMSTIESFSLLKV